MKKELVKEQRLLTERKAEEFCRIMQMPKKVKGLNNGNLWLYLKDMSDVEWDSIMRKILVNRSRDPNVGKFTLPKLDMKEVHLCFDLIWGNNECGIHNSYWSRIIWMCKGGKLIKAFPPNAIMEKFERGERRA